MIRMPGNVQKFFFYFCFLDLSFFITFIPLNKIIMAIPIIVIVPYIYLLLSKKPIRDKLQGRKVTPRCIITYFSCFKMIRDIPQLPWIYLSGTETHVLLLETVRHKKRLNHKAQARVKFYGQNAHRFLMTYASLIFNIRRHTRFLITYSPLNISVILRSLLLLYTQGDIFQ